MSEQVVHPLTGEILPDDLDALVVQEATVDAYLRTQRRHYIFRRRLRERIAELRGKAELPKPLWRTYTQHRVGGCPRCGHGQRIDDEVAQGPEADPFLEPSVSPG